MKVYIDFINFENKNLFIILLNRILNCTNDFQEYFLQEINYYNIFFNSDKNLILFSNIEKDKENKENYKILYSFIKHKIEHIINDNNSDLKIEHWKSLKINLISFIIIREHIFNATNTFDLYRLNNLNNLNEIINYLKNILEAIENDFTLLNKINYEKNINLME